MRWVGIGLALGTALFWACGGGDTDSVVATWGKAELHQSELQRYLPAGLNRQDSATWAKAYLQQWAEEQALVAAAEEKLEDLDTRIAAAKAAFERRLKILAWEDAVLAEKFDSTVSEKAIAEYYKANVDQFTTTEDLIQYRYVGTQNRDTPQLRERLMSEKPEDKRIVETWCRQHANAQHLSDAYLPADALTAVEKKFGGMPLRTFPSGSPVVVTLDATLTPPELHFFFLKDRIPAGQAAPLRRVRSAILNILLQQRRAAILQEARSAVTANATAQLETPTP